MPPAGLSFSSPRRAPGAEGRWSQGAQPPRLRRAGRMTSPGRGRGSERAGAEGLLRHQAQLRSGSVRRAAAMTQGPGGRAAPRPCSPRTGGAHHLLRSLACRSGSLRAPAGFLSRVRVAARGRRGAWGRRPGPSRPALPASWRWRLRSWALASRAAPRPARCLRSAAAGPPGCGDRGARGGRPRPRMPPPTTGSAKAASTPSPPSAMELATPDARVLGPGVSYVVRVSASAGPWDRVLPRASVWTGFPLHFSLDTLDPGKPGVCPSLLSLSP